MSSKVYFSTQSGKSISWYVTNVLTRLSYLIAPSFTKKKIRSLLLKPHNKPPKPIPAAIRTSELETEYGNLAIYRAGDENQPVILFTHGWSGSSAQFYDLMQATAEQGYHCIAFDHYAHHRSTGKECNFPLFVIGLQTIVDQLLADKDLHCVVSHSMGVAGTVNVFHGKNAKHFFIAPFFDFWHELSSRILGAGIPKRRFDQLISQVESDYGIKVKSLEPDLHMSAIKSPIHIIHDPEDKFALYEFSDKYAKQLSNITLQSNENTGHMRIVNNKDTLAALINFIR